MAGHGIAPRHTSLDRFPYDLDRIQLRRIEWEEAEEDVPLPGKRKDLFGLVDPAVVQDHQDRFIPIRLPDILQESGECLGGPLLREGVDGFPVEGIEPHCIDCENLCGIPPDRLSGVPDPAAVDIGPVHGFVFESDDEFSVSDSVQRFVEVFLKPLRSHRIYDGRSDTVWSG